eukprot:8432735-Lingulodinium_polyedra.AAC.1
MHQGENITSRLGTFGSQLTIRIVWSRAFGDCPFTVDGGEDLCVGPAEARVTADLFPRSSWFRYHGTGLHSALVAIAQNTMNKSEK